MGALVAVVLGLVATQRAALGEPECSSSELNAEAWTSLIGKPRSQWEPSFERMKSCVAQDPKYRSSLDDVAVSLLRSFGAGPLPQYPRAYVAFIERALTINAEAGYAASQHNLAAMHQVAPGDHLAEYVDQDYDTFMRWTCRAGAQREPRAIFNLAARTGGKEELPFIIQHDDRLTYRLLSLAMANTRTFPELRMTEAYLKGPLKAVKRRLGAKETKKLDEDLATFDFSAACKLD